MQPIRPSTSLRNNVFETGKLFDGRGDKVSSNAREGERRVARGILRTKIPSLSTAYTVYLFESREREYKTEEFVRNGTGLFSIIIIIQESWTSIDRDIFFCFFSKKMRVSRENSKVWTKREFDDRSMTASIRFVSRLFRDSRYPFNCISANRSTLDESICQRVSVQTTANWIGNQCPANRYIACDTKDSHQVHPPSERLILQRQRDSLGRCWLVSRLS